MSYPTSLCTSHASSKYRCRSLSTQSDEAGMNAFMEFEREMAKKRLQANIPSSQLDLNMPLEPPIKPKDDECCHLDCPNCVLLVYQVKPLNMTLLPCCVCSNMMRTGEAIGV
jgi:hypothetical protein